MILNSIEKVVVLPPLPVVSEQFLNSRVSANPRKWSVTLKQFVGNSGRIFWLFSTILWGWGLKGETWTFCEIS